ncbi:MAG: peptidoglycan D,D-transpeptidase FtsI family protein [Campylobacterales bacterium]
MEKTGKVLAIFLLIVCFFVIFLSGVVSTIGQKNYARSYFKEERQEALRGSIITADGLTLAQSSRRWQVVFDSRHIEEHKKPLMARLLGLYMDRDEAEILDLLSRGGRVMLQKDLTTREAKNLQHLSVQLDRMGVFKTFQQNGNALRFGLEIAPLTPPARLYPYGDLAQPVLGYVQKQNGGEGQMGLERYYQAPIDGKEPGVLRALRDAGGNLIYNNKLTHTRPRHGDGLALSLNARLQYDLEQALDRQQQRFEAGEIIVGVMESRTGRLVALASSNRYDAELITQETLPHTRMNAVQYPFEPGSVMKPFIVALLFEEGTAGQYDLVRGYNGRLKIGSETVTDTVPKEWFSVEDVIVYSSNVGITQLALNLSPYKLHDGLNSFGFSRQSGIDLPYEAVGELPGLHRYRTDIYRATTGYGYGLRVTFMQLLKAYNVFNNSGHMVTPHLADKLSGTDAAAALPSLQSTRVVGEATAMKLLQILRKTVTKGTGREADVEGLFIAGKTGTAHIARAGSYKNDYHSTFFGFANDAESRYTIGVLFIDPRQGHLAGKTTAPAFRETVNLLVKHGLLKPE